MISGVLVYLIQGVGNAKKGGHRTVSDVGRGGQRRADGHEQGWGMSSGVSRCLIFFMEGEDSKSETGIVGPLEGGEAVTDDASVVQLRELLTWSRASWL